MELRQKLYKDELDIFIRLSKDASTPIETLISTLDELVLHIQSIWQTLERIDRHTNTPRRTRKD
jgi:hypothetical protein